MAKHAKRNYKKWLVLPLLVSFFGIVPVVASATPSLQTLNLIGGLTDTDNRTSTPSVGSPDPFTETSTDGGLTWHPAYLVGGDHPWGSVAGTNSWLNCAPSFNECLDATSLYRYRFWVPADFTDPTIDGSMIMDNFGSVFLNSYILVDDAPGDYTFDGITSISGKLVAGWNELRVQLRDVGGLAGINFNLQIAIHSESPMELAKPGVLVTYDAQGGTPTRTRDSIPYGRALMEFAEATKPGLYFVGWFTGPTSGAKAHTPFTSIDEVTLYAHWSVHPPERLSNSTPEPTPTPTPIEPRRKLISTFKADKAQLLKPMFGQIKTFITGLPANAVITCQGSTRNTKITMFDKWLARKRATNVCLQAQKLRSDITFNITLNPASANRVSARHVWMIFR